MCQSLKSSKSSKTSNKANVSSKSESKGSKTTNIERDGDSDAPTEDRTQPSDKPSNLIEELDKDKIVPDSPLMISDDSESSDDENISRQLVKISQRMRSEGHANISLIRYMEHSDRKKRGESHSDAESTDGRLSARGEAALRERCDRLSRENLALSDLLSSKKSECEDIRRRYKDRVSELEDDVERVRSEKARLADMLKLPESERDSLSVAERDLAVLRKRLEESEARNSEVLQDNEELKQEVRDIELEMREMHDHFQQEESIELRELQKELESTSRDCRLLHFKLRKAERRSENLAAECEEYEEKVSQLERTLSGCEDRKYIESLEEELRVAKEVSIQLHDECERIQGKCSQQEEELSVLRKTRPHHNEHNFLSSDIDSPADHAAPRPSLCTSCQQKITTESPEDSPRSGRGGTSFAASVQSERDPYEGQSEDEIRSRLRAADQELKSVKRRLSNYRSDNDNLLQAVEYLRNKLEQTGNASPKTERENKTADGAKSDKLDNLSSSNSSSDISNAKDSIPVFGNSSDRTNTGDVNSPSVHSMPRAATSKLNDSNVEHLSDAHVTVGSLRDELRRLSDRELELVKSNSELCIEVYRLKRRTELCEDVNQENESRKSEDGAYGSRAHDDVVDAAALEEELRSQQELIVRLEMEAVGYRRDLEAMLETLRRKEKQFADERKGLQRKNRELSEVFDMLTQKTNKPASHCVSIQTDSEPNTEHNTCSHTEVELSNASKTESDKETEKLKDKSNGDGSKTLENKTEIPVDSNSSAVTLAEITEKCAKLEKELHQKDILIRSKDEVIKRKEFLVNRSVKSVKDLETFVAERGKIISEKEKEKTEIEMKLKDCEEKCKKLDCEVKVLNDKLKANQINLNDVKKSLDENQNLVKSLKLRNEELEKLKKEDSKLQERLKIEFEKATSDLQNERVNSEKFKKSYERGKEKIQELEKQIESSCREQIKQLADGRREREKLESRVFDLEKEKKDLSRKMHELKLDQILSNSGKTPETVTDKKKTDTGKCLDMKGKAAGETSDSTEAWRKEKTTLEKIVEEQQRFIEDNSERLGSAAYVCSICRGNSSDRPVSISISHESKRNSAQSTDRLTNARSRDSIAERFLRAGGGLEERGASFGAQRGQQRGLHEARLRSRDLRTVHTISTDSINTGRTSRVPVGIYPIAVHHDRTTPEGFTVGSGQKPGMDSALAYQVPRTESLERYFTATPLASQGAGGTLRLLRRSRTPSAERSDISFSNHQATKSLDSNFEGPQRGSGSHVAGQPGPGQRGEVRGEGLGTDTSTVRLREKKSDAPVAFRRSRSLSELESLPSDNDIVCIANPSNPISLPPYEPPTICTTPSPTTTLPQAFPETDTTAKSSPSIKRRSPASKRRGKGAAADGKRQSGNGKSPKNKRTDNKESRLSRSEKQMELEQSKDMDQKQAEAQEQDKSGTPRVTVNRSSNRNSFYDSGSLSASASRDASPDVMSLRVRKLSPYPVAPPSMIISTPGYKYRARFGPGLRALSVDRAGIGLDYKMNVVDLNIRSANRLRQETKSFDATSDTSDVEKYQETEISTILKQKPSQAVSSKAVTGIPPVRDISNATSSSYRQLPSRDSSYSQTSTVSTEALRITEPLRINTTGVRSRNDSTGNYYSLPSPTDKHQRSFSASPKSIRRKFLFETQASVPSTQVNKTLYKNFGIDLNDLSPSESGASATFDHRAKRRDGSADALSSSIRSQDQILLSHPAKHSGDIVRQMFGMDAELTVSEAELLSLDRRVNRNTRRKQLPASPDTKQEIHLTELSCCQTDATEELVSNAGNDSSEQLDVAAFKERSSSKKRLTFPKFSSLPFFHRKKESRPSLTQVWDDLDIESKNTSKQMQRNSTAVQSTGYSGHKVNVRTAHSVADLPKQRSQYSDQDRRMYQGNVKGDTFPSTKPSVRASQSNPIKSMTSGSHSSTFSIHQLKTQSVNLPSTVSLNQYRSPSAGSVTSRMTSSAIELQPTGSLMTSSIQLAARPIPPASRMSKIIDPLRRLRGQSPRPHVAPSPWSSSVTSLSQSVSLSSDLLNQNKGERFSSLHTDSKKMKKKIFSLNK